MNRRQYLLGVGVAAGFAGCGGFGNRSGDTTEPPDEATPTSTVQPTETETPTSTSADDGTGANDDDDDQLEDSVPSQQQVKLSSEDHDGGDSFGVSVEVSADGSTAVVGAESDDNQNGLGAGSAYVFS